MVKSIKPHYGSVVYGSQRFTRPELEAEFDSALLGGNGALLFGLRRIGKSTEAAACAERLRDQGLTVIEIDTQGLTSEADLLLRICANLPTQGWGAKIIKAISDDSAIATGVRTALQQLNREKLGDIEAYFSTIATTIERAIETASANADSQNQGRLLLFIDEFPWLCRSILDSDADNGRQRINQLFAALRRWRGAGMSMLLIGSIGLIGLGREHKLDLDHLNDLTSLSMPPLQDSTRATAFVNALAHGSQITNWSEQHTQAVLDESIAWYPAMLQKAFQVLTAGNKAVALERISDMFADKIRPELDRTFFDQFDRRMKRYKALKEAWATHLPKLCETVLSSNTLITRETLRSSLSEAIDEADLGDALAMLREDGFLDVRINKDGGQLWRPASPLVTAWRDRRRGGR